MVKKVSPAKKKLIDALDAAYNKYKQECDTAYAEYNKTDEGKARFVKPPAKKEE